MDTTVDRMSRPTVFDHELVDNDSLRTVVMREDLNHVRRLCDIYGVTYGPQHNRLKLIKILGKARSQPFVYDGFAHDDLVALTISRKLQLTKITRSRLSKFEELSEMLQNEYAQRDIRKGQDRAKRLQQKRITTSSTPSAEPQPPQDSIKVAPPRRSARISTMKQNVNRESTSGRLGKSPENLTKGRINATIRSRSRSRSARPGYISKKLLEKLRRDTNTARRISQNLLIEELENADKNVRLDFFKLPPELRNRIYHLVCRSSGPIDYTRRQPAIARTCRLLRIEALPVYYGFNRFIFYTNPCAHKFLGEKWLDKRILPHHLSCIRSFAFVSRLQSGIVCMDFGFRGQAFAMEHWKVVHGSRYVNWRPWDQNYDRAHPDFEDSVQELWEKKKERPRLSETLRLYQSPRRNPDDLLLLFKATVKAAIEKLEHAKFESRKISQERQQWCNMCREWDAQEGFSAPSIRRITSMLNDVEDNVYRLWRARL